MNDPTNIDRFGGRRRSGRTQRMLEAVKAAVDSGAPYVFVVAANRQHAELLAQQLCGMLPGSSLAGGTRVFTVENRQITIETPNAIGLQWTTGDHCGSPTIPVFVDHFAIESSCGWALQQWLRWTTEVPHASP